MMRRQRQVAANAAAAGVTSNQGSAQTKQAPTPGQQKAAPNQQKPAAAVPPKTEAATNQGTPAAATKNIPSTPPKPVQPVPPKQEPVTPVPDLEIVMDAQKSSIVVITDNESMEPNDSETGTESTGKKHRWFTTNKKPSVRAKERKIRQNRRLRKILIPKNALMALHELKGISMSEFAINNRTEGGFSAKVTVNNMQYEGIGNSKTASKNNACEKALRDHIIYKMISSNRKKSISEEITDNEEQDVEMKENEEDAASKLLKEEEDVPMLNLASFALFKLFTEWESEGFEIPEFRQTQNNTNGAITPPPPSVKRELPPSWESMHPASLLCIMRPGIQYTYLGGEGQPPKTIQRVGVCVDGQNFIGEGRSQKIARRNAAMQACNTIFNTNFTAE